MSEQTRHFYEFEPFTIDVARRLLLRQGTPVPLKPKVFDTLLVLVENSGRVLDKEELMQTIWPDTAIEENNLTQNISAIRRSLGDSREQHQYVVTVPGRGYRFVANVQKLPPAAMVETEESHIEAEPLNTPRPAVGPRLERALVPPSVEPGDAAKRTNPSLVAATPGVNEKRYWLLAGVALVLLASIAVIFIALPRFRSRTDSNPPAANAGTNKAIKSIAVLRFASLNAAVDEESTGAGMADALITKLSNSKQLTVRSTSAVLRYNKPDQDPLIAGRELGVDSVLDGKIQRAGDRVRVTVQLVRVGDRASLWAQTFDEKFTDIFAMQDSISEQVVKALTLQLSREERERMLKRYTENTVAYQAYLKGRYFLDKRTAESVKKARDQFQEAVDRDQNYALAYAGLADCYHRFAQFGIEAPLEVIPKATEAVNKALRLDDSLAEAHATLGIINFRYHWDMLSAEREFKRALELDPRYAVAHVWYALELMAMDRFKQADVEMHRAIELEPLSLTVNNALGDYYAQLRRYDDALLQYRKTLEMDTGFVAAQTGIARAYEQKGMYKEALDQYREVQVKSDRKLMPLQSGYTYAISGNKDEARKILNRALVEAKKTEGYSYLLAALYAGLGEKDEAFKWLEKSAADHTLLPGPLRFDPRLDSLRSDPRFKEIMKRVGLPS